MGRRFAAALGLLAVVAGGAGTAAAEKAACGAAAGESVTVRAIGADFSLALTDGRLIRLAGIDPVAEPPALPGLVAEAQGRLTAWLAGKPATLRLLGAEPDRWGRLPGLVFAEAGGAGVPAAQLSVAVAMLEAGFARGRPEPQGHPCWTMLRMAEDSARAARLGVWRDPAFAVRAATDPGLAGLAGTLVLVEGRIRHVGQTRTHVYLDLGLTREGLTLRLRRGAAFILDQGGLGQIGRTGRLIRARGILDAGMQLRIDIDDADQIEGLDDSGPAVAAP